VATAAGWFQDPYGRYEQRYWDGSAWTEHVSTQGTQAVDPLGATTVVPIVTPATAFDLSDASTTASVATQTTQPRKFLDSLGPDARHRPAPRLSVALAGGGGALVALGVTALIFGDSGTRGSAFTSALLILLGSLAVRLAIKGQPDLASAAVGAGVVGLIMLGAAIVFDDIGDAWGTFIMGLLFLAAWVLPGFRGRPLMLGIGALFMVAAVGIGTAGDDAGQGEVFSELPFSDVVGDQEVVFLLAAALLLGMVWWLDHAGYFGVGTSLVVAGLISAFVGVGQATSNLDDVGAAILITAVGLFVCFVGSHGDRRATTWWGALLATIGVVGFFGSVMTPDSIGSTAGMLLLSGAVLVAGPAVYRAIRSSQQNAKSSPAGTAGGSTLPPPAV
jgi:hypothetical protein